jgi:radical SAM superfamily enzyme YgiQ (UPF0313 family)
MNKTNEKMRAVLVGIAGSNNAFSLSVYNLKAFAYNDSETRKDWDIEVIQSPLIGLFKRDELLSDLTEKIALNEPNLVGFSCYMWNIEVVLKIAKKLRKRLPDLQILIGGPEIATEYVQQSYFDKHAVDYCISGEGELTFFELLQNLKRSKPALKNIPGLAYRSKKNMPFTVNTKRLPFKSLSYVPSPYLKGIVDEEVLARNDVEANLETQRGCNLRCTYCIYHKDMDRVTYSDVDRVVDEVRYVTKRGVKKIRFVDANFSSDKDFAKSVMKGLIKERFETSLFFELIPGFIDEELAGLFGQYKKLHLQNEITVGVGVQTINLEVLKRMRRRIKKEKFELTFNLLQKHDIYTKIDLIIGLPGEDASSIERTLEYMVDQLRGSRSHLLCCHTMRGLPGTELLEVAKEFKMKFSSKYEPHELIESPILPRADMVKSMRRTGVLFRLINHTGWADKEFIFGNTSEKTNIRDLFFDTRDQLGISNIQLVDKIVDLLIEHLKPRKSWFSMSDFPHAETWWWVHSKREISDDWIVSNLTEIKKGAFNVDKPTEILLEQI